MSSLAIGQVSTVSSVSPTSVPYAGKFLDTPNKNGVFIDVNMENAWAGGTTDHVGVAFFIEDAKMPPEGTADVPNATNAGTRAWNGEAFGVIFNEDGTIQYERWYHNASDPANNYAASVTGNGEGGYSATWAYNTIYRVTSSYSNGNSVVAVYTVNPSTGDVVSQVFQKTLSGSDYNTGPLHQRGNQACVFGAGGTITCCPYALYN